MTNVIFADFSADQTPPLSTSPPLSPRPKEDEFLDGLEPIGVVSARVVGNLIAELRKNAI